MRRQPGDVIGRFVIRAPLGAGGMGEVYRATDTRLQRDVALKVMNARRLGDPAARRRWVVEARAAAALTHPNIVVVHEIGEDDDLYIAMELVEGRSLRDVLQDGPLLAERVHNLASDIASALAAAHRRGIVHRDIKPENILITDAGHAKVLDFGIAKVVDNPDDARDVGDASTVAQATAPGLIIGSPLYMSPEQACGDAVDPGTDIFSLGVVLYEASTGALPFQGERRIDLVSSILNHEPPSLVDAGLPVDLAEMIARCLEKRPANRFADGSALFAALSAPSPRTQEAPSSGARSARKDPRPALVIAAAGFAVVAAIVSAGVVGLTDEDARAPATTTPSGAATSGPSTLLEQALHARRRGGTNVRSLLREALEKNPDDALARLHLLLAFVEWPGNGRETYTALVPYREALAPEDAATLRAIEPLFLDDPPDRSTALDRLQALLAERPRDVQLLFARARIRLHTDPRQALGDFTELLNVDPEFLGAVGLRAELMVLSGRRDEGRRELERCIEAAPENTNCLRQRVRLDRDAGRCDDVTRGARRWLTLDPTSSSAKWMLAEGLAPSEGYSAAVDDLAQQFGDLVPVVARPGFAAQMKARVAAGRGDFDEALRLLEASATQRTSVEVDWPHELAARFAVRLLDEIDRRDDAADVAATYLSRRSLWGAPDRSDDLAIAHDPTGLLLATLAANGELTEPELVDKLGARRAFWNTNATPEHRDFIAPYLIAPAATTPERAAALLDESFDDEALPTYFPGNPGHAYLGAMLLAAGKPRRALPHLERATRACYLGMFPIVSTRAWLDLARAREATDDDEGACGAYRVVLERWGKATPTSRSATEARAGSARLRCLAGAERP